MSPDNLASTCVRKSTTNNFKSSKEDQNGVENSRITPNNGNTTQATTTTVAVTNFDANGVMQKSPPKTHQDNIHHHHQNHQQQASSSSAINQTNESSPSRNSACLGGGSSGGCVGGGGNDLLLQWGPRKRLRCSRTEGRSMVSVVLDKHQAATNHVMPPPHPPPSLPSTSSNGSRSGSSTRVKPHGLLYSKEAPAFLPTKNRNLVDQMGSNSASPSKNGGVSSRPVSRSTVGKRSPSCIEKNDKKISSSGPIRKVKSDDSLVPATVNGNHLNLAQGEHEHGHSGSGHAAAMVRSPVADAEKGGEVVECPRIYISLSRKEKEDDFYAMKGTKLPHRPKKRAKAVDRALQYCFPGLWLSDLTRARYEVRERKSAKKPRRRGLKGLETMESDSE